MRVFVSALLFLSPVPVGAERVETVPDPVFAEGMRGLFDVPVKVSRSTLPPREAGDPRGSVRCFSYPSFMVKEIDYGEHGDDRILVSASGAKPSVECSTTQDANEMMLSGSAESYFLGAKERFGFAISTLSSDGSPLTIYGLTSDHEASIGGAIFTDTLAPDTVPTRLSVVGDELSLDYIASASGSCSIPTDGARCWKILSDEAHLPSEVANALPPIALYERGYGGGSATSTPSVVTYPVHLTIDAADHAIARAGPLLSCKPQS